MERFFWKMPIYLQNVRPNNLTRNAHGGKVVVARRERNRRAKSLKELFWSILKNTRNSAPQPSLSNVQGAQWGQFWQIKYAMPILNKKKAWRPLRMVKKPYRAVVEFALLTDLQLRE